MRNGSLIKRPLFSALIAAALGVALAGPSAAQSPTRESRAVAWSTYQGSYARTPCSDSLAFWACRGTLSSASAFEPENRDEASATNGSVVRAERDAKAFDSDVFVDITPATSSAQARTDFGRNQAQAAAWNSRVWTETRVNSANNPGQSSIIGVTHAGAAAWSTYSEIFTPDKDGQITLQFELDQHPGSGRPGFSGPVSDRFYEGNGYGSLLVSVVALDPIVGSRFVGDGRVSRNWERGSGTSFLDVVFDAQAGKRYRLISELQVEASENASADFYGTASLERILVTPGMALAVGSGTAYAVMAVPEPETYALMLAGLALVGWAARRRHRA